MGQGLMWWVIGFIIFIVAMLLWAEWIKRDLK